MAGGRVVPAIVPSSFVEARLDEVVLADVRWYADGRSGFESYLAGHLPGARYVDLDTALAAGPSDEGGRHPLPGPGEFATAMSAAGIADDDLVVAYDDAGGVIAARLAWMLRVTGHDAALLDGGTAAWPGPLEAGEVAVEPATFSARPWPAERLATIDEVASLPAGTVLVDARPRERYEGAPDPLDPRAGHIPGARCLPCREQLGQDGALVRRGAVLANHRALGIGPSTPVVASCGSGVTACHELLVLEWLGLGPGRLFPGSWSQWSRDPSRPVATGADSVSMPAARRTSR